MNKTTVLVVALLVAGTSQAKADGYDWSGVYGGIYGGGAWSNGIEYDEFALFANNPANPYRASVSGNNLSIGGLLGMNKQFSNGFVVGSEFDVGIGSSASGIFGDSFGTNPGTSFKINGGFSGSGRVRLGYSVGKLMPFVTGGVAYTNFSMDELNCANPGCVIGHRTGTGQAFGATIGAGVNYALTDNVILGAEYRYSNYGPTSVTTVLDNATTSALQGKLGNYQFNLQTSEVRATLAFKF